MKKSLNEKKEKVGSSEDKKVSTNLCYDERKSFAPRQIQCRRYKRVQGSLAPLHFDLLEILFLEHHVTTRKPTLLQNGIIPFNPSYLTKVTDNSTIEVLKYRKFNGSSFKHQTQHPKFTTLNLIGH